MQARLFAFVLWAAVAATLVFWALRLGPRAPAVPAQAVAVSTSAGARGDLDRLLGRNAPVAQEEPQVAPDAGRFQLVGVVAAGGGAQGLALIAVDGKTARTYRVGAVVDERYVLQSVRTRGATLGPRGGQGGIELELPPLPTASVGTLPAAGTEEPAGALPNGRPPLPGAAAPHNLPPGQAFQGMARQPIAPQDMPPQVQEMPVPHQDVEPPPPEPAPGQGG
ncbi:type II secretion system protein N [Azohydromonas aeria]|uniref:type II secretion system protein N n=1 Tax=Azohydromonas aeria TaxID=2590212 RepID=UPI0012FABF83|nr:type II secretion system protein N [Azohydromonas aeria]